MEPWILVTLAAATLQNFRTVLQKRLIGRLSVAGSTYARFLYGLPLTWAGVWLAVEITGQPMPDVSWRFIGYVAVAGVAQILGNALFIHLIRGANFTVITSYIKVETVVGALLSFLLLGDRLSALGIVGVIVTLLGVMVLSAGKSAFTLRSLVMALGESAALGGMAVGALYAVASTAIRGASLTLGDTQPVLAALFGLAWVTLLQAIALSVWLAATAPLVLRETIRAWRPAVWVGISGVTASGLWYLAFTLQVTAYVLALGQVELIFAYLASRYLFKEHTHPGELVGMAVTVAGILIVVAGR